MSARTPLQRQVAADVERRARSRACEAAVDATVGQLSGAIMAMQANMPDLRTAEERIIDMFGTARPPRKPAYSELAWPWEKPSRWHPILRMRYQRRIVRINGLERATGVVS